MGQKYGRGRFPFSFFCADLSLFPLPPTSYPAQLALSVFLVFFKVQQKQTHMFTMISFKFSKIKLSTFQVVNIFPNKLLLIQNVKILNYRISKNCSIVQQFQNIKTKHISKKTSLQHFKLSKTSNVQITRPDFHFGVNGCGRGRERS